MENTDTTEQSSAQPIAETTAAMPAKPSRFAWHSKLVLALIVFVPVYFMIAALGTKFGLWSWMFGLGTLIGGGALYVIGALGIAALVSLLIAVLRKPRSKLAIAIAALGILVPVGAMVMLGSAQSTAAANPIHDVATDTGNPPAFSADTMAAREESGANPLSDYQTPLGELDMYAGSPPELAIKSHAQIITDSYADLSPLPLGGASREDAVAAVAAAMGTMGFADISSDVEAGRVEGVAETFWFGFKDDVVARIGENEIDFRSVSRVGRSDLGANSARIAELRELVAAQIGQR